MLNFDLYCSVTKFSALCCDGSFTDTFSCQAMQFMGFVFLHTKLRLLIRVCFNKLNCDF